MNKLFVIQKELSLQLKCGPLFFFFLPVKSVMVPCVLEEESFDHSVCSGGWDGQ